MYDRIGCVEKFLRLAKHWLFIPERDIFGAFRQLKSQNILLKSSTGVFFEDEKPIFGQPQKLFRTSNPIMHSIQNTLLMQLYPLQKNSQSYEAQIKRYRFKSTKIVSFKVLKKQNILVRGSQNVFFKGKKPLPVVLEKFLNTL